MATKVPLPLVVFALVLSMFAAHKLGVKKIAMMTKKQLRANALEPSNLEVLMFVQIVNIVTECESLT